MARGSTPDLERLIDAAQAEAQTQAVRPMASHQRRPLMRWLGGLALLGVALLGVQAAWLRLGPPAAAAAERDVEAVLNAAREAVERARAQDGRLPETLPDAALAGVVQYEPAGGRYRLSASWMGVRVTLEPNGHKTRQRGVEP